MKEKAKYIYHSLKLGLLLAPGAALAQFKPPSTGETNLPSGKLYDIIKTIMMWLLGVLGFVAVIGFVISGIMYLVAAGDEDTQKKAKKAMYYSITGVIVGLIGLVVVFAIQTMLQGSTGSPKF